MVQGLCGLGLVSGGPGLGELGWCEVAVSGVRSAHVVVDAVVLDEHLGFEHRIELPQFSSSSCSRPLNDSIHAFCHGEPGSMNESPWV